RSKEWVYFTAHGLDADLVSREAFKNTSAVSFQSGGLPSITISVKVFSSLVPALLAKNFRIEVWEQLAGSSTWTRRLSASPGNVEAIMADISS
ncbi:unnamed protein product, partial [Ectocarpus sp. 8 AP-2014]